MVTTSATTATPAISQQDIYDAFISYSRDDTPFVRAVYDALQKQGLRIWYDKGGNNEIVVGRDFTDEISQGILGSNNILIFLSPSSARSRACQEEIAFALCNGKDGDDGIAIIDYLPLTQDQSDEWVKGCREKLAEQLKTKKLSDTERKRIESKIDRLPKYHRLTFNPSPTTSRIQNEPYSDANAAQFEPSLDAIVADIVKHIHRESQFRRGLSRWSVRTSASVGKRNAWLRGNDLEQAEDWLESGEKHGHPIPVDVKEYIIASRKAQLRDLRTRFGLILGILVVVIVAAILLAISAEAERIAKENEAAARVRTYQQLQTQNVINSSVSIPLQAVPEEPLFVGGSIWIVLPEAGKLQQLASDSGQLLGEWDVGEQATAPMSDGHYIYVLSRKAKQVIQVDPNPVDGKPPVSIAMLEISSPRLLNVTAGMAWVSSTSSLERLDFSQSPPTSTQYKNIGHGIREVVTGADGIWLIDRTDQKIFYKSAQPDSISAKPIPVPNVILTDGAHPAMALDDKLWLTQDDMLYQIDANNLGAASATQLSQPLSSPQSDGNRVWISSGNTLYAFDTKGQQLPSIDVGKPINAIYPLDGRLWVVTEDDHLLSYDAVQHTPLSKSVVIPKLRDYLPPVSDGHHLWLSNPSTNTISLIRLEDNTLLPALTNCAFPQSPHVDPANVWFVCKDAQELRRFPTNTTYIPIDSYAKTNYSLRPLLINGRVWIAQENNGQIASYPLAAPQQIDTLPLDSPIIRFQNSQKYIWAFTTNGNVTRINPDTLVAAGTVHLPGTLVDVYVDDEHGKLWVTTQEAPSNIHLIEMDSLNVTTFNNYTPWGLLLSPQPKSDVLWVASDTRLARFQLSTGKELPPTAPVSGFISSPAFTTSDAWVVVYTEKFEAASGTLYQLDLTTGQLMNAHAYAARLLPPIVVDDKLWMLTTYAPGVPTLQQRPTGSGLVVFDPSTGEFTSLIQPAADETPECGTLGNLTHVGNYVWIACLDQPGTVFAYKADDPGSPIKYSQLGAGAWDFVEVGNQLWLPYRDTNNVVIFSADDGSLLQRVGLGKAPSALLPTKDDIWLFNSAEGGIQRISR